MAHVCQTCHSELYEGAQFCPRCGRYTDAVDPVAPVLPAQSPHQQPHQVTTPLPDDAAATVVQASHQPAAQPTSSGTDWRRWVLLPLAGIVVGSLIGVSVWGFSRLGNGSDDPTTGGPNLAATACAAHGGDDIEIAGRRVALYAGGVAQNAPLLPTIIALDGNFGAPALIERYSKTGERLGSADGGVLVAQPEGHPAAAPNGTRSTAADGLRLSSWDVSDAAAIAAGADPQRDIGYLERMINRLVADHCADPSRVMLTGLSTGATAALRAACRIDPVAGGFDGVRLVAGVDPLVLAPSLEPTPFGCATARELEVVIVSGTGPGLVGDGALPVDDWFDRFTTTALGCDAPAAVSIDPGEAAPPPAVCGAGRALNLHVDGLGHSWPGGEPPGFAYRADGAQTLADYVVERPNLDPTSFDFTAYLAELVVA